MADDGITETHAYPDPIGTDAGQNQRIDFLFARISVLIGEGRAHAKFRSAGYGIGRGRRHKQYRYAALLEQLDAMEDPTAYGLASKIVDGRADVEDKALEIDRLRKEIGRAIDARKRGLADGTWKPSMISHAAVMIEIR